MPGHIEDFPQSVRDIAWASAGTRVTVGTTPTLILPVDTMRTCATLRNLGTADADLGGDNTVLANQGFALKNQDAFDVRAQGEVWGVTASGTASIAVWIEKT